MTAKAFVFCSVMIASASPSFGQGERFVVSAVKTGTPPTIDGTVNTEEWQGAAVATDFIQFVPSKGSPASYVTIVRIFYDDNYLYFGFTCDDPEPKKIQLGTGRRDGLSSTTGTDSVTVELDTFNDDRTSYYFRTNPLGVQHDGRVTENGRVSDTDWDGIWKSAGAWTRSGWSAEMAIPFRTMKYRPGANQTWGLQFSRYLPRKFEKSFWTGPLVDYNLVSGNGSLVGLDLRKGGGRPMFIPHVISRIQEGRATDVQVGLDVRHALGQTVSGYLTLNPDFSTVEADQEVVNLTRFELNLPEKRNFFIEGNDAFQQDIRLFYSRRISDIWGGIKVYGRTGTSEFSVLTTETKRDDEAQAPPANITGLRLKHNIMGSSTIGFVAANKLSDGISQGSFGLDTSMFLTKTFRLSAQAAMSYRDKGTTDVAFFVRPSYDSTTFHAHLRYQHLGEHFGDNANAVGFIPDDNRRELDSAVNKTFWMKKWNLDRIEYKSGYNIYWGMDNRLRSWDVVQGIRGDLRNKFSLELRHASGFKLFEDRFRNDSSTVELGYNTREWRSLAIGYQFGRNFGSDFGLVTAQVKQNVTRRLSLQYNLSKLSYTPDPKRQSTWIHVVMADQYFTKDLFLKCFYQVNSAIGKKNAQVVFVYRFQPPFGLMQVAYQFGSTRFGETGSEGHTVFAKFAYVF
jgi:hypothetical protein